MFATGLVLELPLGVEGLLRALLALSASFVVLRMPARRTLAKLSRTAPTRPSAPPTTLYYKLIEPLNDIRTKGVLQKKGIGF